MSADPSVEPSSAITNSNGSPRALSSVRIRSMVAASSAAALKAGTTTEIPPEFRRSAASMMTRSLPAPPEKSERPSGPTGDTLAGRVPTITRIRHITRIRRIANL